MCGRRAPGRARAAGHRALLARRRAARCTCSATCRACCRSRSPTRSRACISVRENRNHAIVERLAELGVPVEWDDVVRRAQGTVGRPHIAEAMVAAGHVVDRNDAFARYLADDAPAYVPTAALTPEEAVSLIAESGGAPVLAHPAQLELAPARAGRLRRPAGRRRPPRHRGLPARARPRAARGARRPRARRGLAATAGSDFHRPPAARRSRSRRDRSRAGRATTRCPRSASSPTRRSARDARADDDRGDVRVRARDRRDQRAVADPQLLEPVHPPEASQTAADRPPGPCARCRPGGSSGRGCRRMPVSQRSALEPGERADLAADERRPAAPCAASSRALPHAVGDDREVRALRVAEVAVVDHRHAARGPSSRARAARASGASCTRPPAARARPAGSSGAPPRPGRGAGRRPRGSATSAAWRASAPRARSRERRPRRARPCSSGEPREVELGHRVVVQVAADAGQVEHHVDAEPFEIARRPDARAQQDRRGAVRARRQHDASGLDHERAPVADRVHPRRAARHELDPIDDRVAERPPGSAARARDRGTRTPRSSGCRRGCWRRRVRRRRRRRGR